MNMGIFGSGRIEAVVFDLFDTLVYCAKRLDPYGRLFRDLDLSQEEITELRLLLRTRNFSHFRESVKLVRPQCGHDFSAYQRGVEEEIASAAAFPETMNVLQELKKRGLRLGLLSNLATPYKRVFFNLGLAGFFEQVIFSCDAGLVKPDQRIYELMIGRLGVEPGKIIMTGDQVAKDVAPPHKIGMQAIHLDRRAPGFTPASIFSLDGIFQYL